MITQEKWVAELRKFKGKQFAHQGRSNIGDPGGVDCIGLIVVAAGNVGITVPPGLPKDYGNLPGTEKFTTWAYRALQPLDVNPTVGLSTQLNVGDVLFFHVENPDEIRHMGVYTGTLNGVPKMIHSSAAYPRKVCEVDLDFNYWLQRFNSAWRIPDVKE
jgi:cell wall-associated NlpC family hydrolase